MSGREVGVEARTLSATVDGEQSLLDGQREELRLVLEIDGDYTRHGGTPDKHLVAAWAVNNKQEEVKFPCWSPFLKADGKHFAVLKRGEGGIWTADFSAKGTHRNNDKNWQEYGYYWLVQKRDFQSALFLNMKLLSRTTFPYLEY